MPQITHCPVFDCHNLTVWAEHRDHCMEQKDPTGSTVSLPGLFIVLNDLCVMGFSVRLWENYFSSGSLNFSQQSHRYGKNDAHIHKVVLRTKWQWIKKLQYSEWNTVMVPKDSFKILDISKRGLSYKQVQKVNVFNMLAD